MLTDGAVKPLGPLQRFIKRSLDLFLIVPGIIVLTPVLLVISLAVKIGSKGPLFFIQVRVGKDGRLFNVLKFRTMIPDAVEHGGYFTSEDDPRITRVGTFLRRWSLDELPQLFNILRGEMSLVGPRPTLKYQVDEYTPRQMNRLLVKPGLTGLAQVSGRNNLPWGERIELDIEYIGKWSLLFDFKLILKTIESLLTRKGVYVENEELASEISDPLSGIRGQSSTVDDQQPAVSDQLEDLSAKSSTLNADSLKERKE